MLRINRTFLLVYDSLIAFAFMLRYILIGPVLFNSTWCFWLTLVVVTVVLIGLSYLTFCHPTPLEIVAYHVNLIMRHRVDENNDEDYNEKIKLIYPIVLFKVLITNFFIMVIVVQKPISIDR